MSSYIKTYPDILQSIVHGDGDDVTRAIGHLIIRVLVDVVGDHEQTACRTYGGCSPTCPTCHGTEIDLGQTVRALARKFDK